MDHLSCAFTLQTIGDERVEKKNCPKLRMVQHAKHQSFLKGIEHARSAVGTIYKVRKKKDTGKICRRWPSGAQGKLIQIQLHKKDVAGGKSSSILFDKPPVECRKVFDFWASPSNISRSRIQRSLVCAVDRDPFYQAIGDVLETIKNELVLVYEALWDDHAQASGAPLAPSLNDQAYIVGGMARWPKFEERERVNHHGMEGARERFVKTLSLRLSSDQSGWRPGQWQSLDTTLS
jgi:hypothetical protein